MNSETFSLLGDTLPAVQELGARLVDQQRPAPGKLAGWTRRTATVTAVSTSTHTVSLQLGGDTATTLTNIPVAEAYLPAVNDAVVVELSPQGLPFVLTRVGGNKRPLAKVRRNSTQSIANASFVAVQWNVEDYDTFGMVDLVANNTRVTVQQPGVYMIIAMSGWAANDTGRRITDIWKNGVAAATRRVEMPVRASVENGTHTGILLDTLAVVGDYYEVRLFHDITGGGSLNTSASGGLQPEMIVWRIG